MDENRIREVVTKHLLTVLKPADFDITGSLDDDGLDISTDEWTIHLESGWGFLAIEDEPELPAAFAAARRKVMPEKVERALIAIDRELDGALSAALETSGDPLSLDFVPVLRSAAN